MLIIQLTYLYFILAYKVLFAFRVSRRALYLQSSEPLEIYFPKADYSPGAPRILHGHGEGRCGEDVCMWVGVDPVSVPSLPPEQKYFLPVQVLGFHIQFCLNKEFHL